MKYEEIVLKFARLKKLSYDLTSGSFDFVISFEYFLFNKMYRD